MDTQVVTCICHIPLADDLVFAWACTRNSDCRLGLTCHITGAVVRIRQSITTCHFGNSIALDSHVGRAIRNDRSRRVIAIHREGFRKQSAAIQIDRTVLELCEFFAEWLNLSVGQVNHNVTGHARNLIAID